MQKNIICVACPMGCGITVELSDNGDILSVTGNTCKRGDAYARTECTHPVRSLATTVKVSGGVHNVVPCKSAGAIPKEKIFDCRLRLKRPSLSEMFLLKIFLARELISSQQIIARKNNIMLSH